jgi:branched-chain amino acid transport system permease protein
MGSNHGLAIRTARHDPLRATADGANVPHLLASTFALSAAVAGVAGWLYAHQMTYIGPDSLTTHTSISVLLMAVVGGARTLLGPVLGAALLSLLTLYLPAAETQGMVYGTILLLVLLLAPDGLTGLLLRRRRHATVPAAAAAVPAGLEGRT